MMRLEADNPERQLAAERKAVEIANVFVGIVNGQEWVPTYHAAVALLACLEATAPAPGISRETFLSDVNARMTDFRAGSAFMSLSDWSNVKNSKFVQTTAQT